MWCILCLSVQENCIEIFEEEGTSLHIDEIIKKHFWLQPSVEDRNGRVICTSCWQELSSFHEFYVQIEKVHYDQLNAIQNSEYTFTDFTSPQAPETIQSQYTIEFLESDDIKPDLKEFVDIPADENNFAVADGQSAASELQSSVECVDLGKLQQTADPMDDKCNVEQIATSEIPKPTESQPKEVKKRYSSPRPPPPRKYRSSGLQHLNAQRMREFDDIIANKLKRLTCAICNNSFCDFSALDRHSRVEHNEGGYMVCCKKKLNKRYLIVDHILIHDNPDHFKCDVCGQVSKDRKCLRVHMRKHSSAIIERKYECTECPFKTHTRTNLKRHMQTHRHITERNFVPCPQCDRFFVSLENMQRHINTVHDKIKCKSGLDAMHPTDNKTEFESKECGRVLASGRSLKHQVTYSHRLEPDKHKCPVCGKGFKIKKFLKEHMTTHTGEVLYTCPHCPKTFNSNANMHSHRKKMHRKEWEENRRHPHLGTSANAKANADAMAAAAAAAAAAEESHQQ